MYTCAVGKIRALESKLLKKDFLLSLSEVEIQTANSRLSSTSYYLKEITEDELFSSLSNEREKDALLISNLLDAPLSLIPVLKDRFLNFKRKIKAKQALPLHLLGEFLIKEDLDPFRNSFLTGLEEEKNLAKLLLKVDRIYLLYLSKLIEESNSSLFKEWLTAEIDFFNLRVFYHYQQKESWLNSFLPGGNLKKDAFREDIQKKVLFYYDSIDFSTPFSFEKSVDNFEAVLWQKSKYIHFGPEPLFSYLFFKDIEMKNIKLILLGKMKNISSFLIKENLRNTYA